MDERVCPECEAEVPDGDYCANCGSQFTQLNLPREGKLHFSETAEDAVQCEADWNDIPEGSDAEKALRNFMHEVEVGVKLTEDHEVKVLSFEGEWIGGIDNDKVGGQL